MDFNISITGQYMGTCCNTRWLGSTGEPVVTPDYRTVLHQADTNVQREHWALHSHQDTYGRNKGDSRCWVDHGDVGVKGAVCDKCVTERNLTAGTCDVEGYGFYLAVSVGDIDADILWLLTCCSIPGDCESCGTWNIPGMSESGTDAGQVTPSYIKWNTTCIF